MLSLGRMTVSSPASTFIAALVNASRGWFFYVAIGIVLLLFSSVLADGLLASTAKLVGALALAGGGVAGGFARAREQRERRESEEQR